MPVWKCNKSKQKSTLKRHTLSTFFSIGLPSESAPRIYTLSYVSSYGSAFRRLFSAASMKRRARISIAQTKEQAEMMVHGIWLRGWYFFNHMNGLVVLPIAYPHSIRAFVVTPMKIPTS